MTHKPGPCSARDMIDWHPMPPGQRMLPAGFVLIKAGARGGYFRLRLAESGLGIDLGEDQVALVAASPGMSVEIMRSGLELSESGRTMLPMLLACHDESGFPGACGPPGATRPADWVHLVAAREIGARKQALENYLIHQLLAPRPWWCTVCRQIRTSESYGIARFLLRESSRGPARLEDLADRYGLSASHFRRLCKTSLGKNAKLQLRHWRLARSLLDIATRGGSLTSIAMENGFSSSSHFSNEVRASLGICPSSLLDITGVLRRRQDG